MSEQEVVLTSSKKKLFDWLESWKRKNFCGVFPVGSEGYLQELEALELDIDNRSPQVVNVKEEPERSDVLIIAGAISHKFKPYLIDLYKSFNGNVQVVLLGSSAIDGGAYKGYAVEGNIQNDIKVDLEIPGSPPTPLQIYEGLKSLGEKSEHA